MANAVYMFLSDCNSNEDDNTTIVSVHVIDLGARGFTMQLPANKFVNMLRTTAMYDLILNTCEDFDFVNVVFSLPRASRINIFETNNAVSYNDIQYICETLRITE